ncbi:RHS repeat-associated core domain-containing protein [Pseudomonas sp. CAM1A]|uniref:RHS repeat-associated core domain-containing protein n=1 Tax=Pseudomonas sp. CAM1A TaxID=3231717 RepID=UPI0039C71B05
MANLYLPFTDWQRSVLGSVGCARAYTPYGAPTNVSGPRLAYCGELRDPVIGIYHLGNGHRSYAPGLKRFHSPDQLSPFGAGGLNAYAYCQGDPVNYRDPTGRVQWANLVPGAAMSQLGRFDKNVMVAWDVVSTNRAVNQARKKGIPAHQLPETFTYYEVTKAVVSPVADLINAGTSVANLLMPGEQPALMALNGATALVDGWTNNWSANHAMDARNRATQARTLLSANEDIEASRGAQFTPPPPQNAVYLIGDDQRSIRSDRASTLSNV